MGTARSVVVVGVVLLATCGCLKRSSQQDCRDVDIFCDGTSVSMIIEGQRSVWADGNYFVPGYLISQREDSWAVTWSLRNDGVFGSADAVYLGKHEIESASQGRVVRRDEGLRPGGLLATGRPGVAMNCDKQLTVLDNGVERRPAAAVLSARNVAWREYAFDRSREHIFAWSPEPAIYSIPDLKVVRKLAPTSAFQEFEKLFWWRDNVKTFLTKDLAYLIVVPFNGASESEQGAQNTKAFCYAIDRDEVSTVSLQGLGDAMILDAELTADGIHWLVQRDDHPSEWAIMRSDSSVTSEFSLPQPPRSLCFCWDPVRELFWVVQMPMVAPDIQALTRGITVLKFKISDGSYVEMRLPPANLVVPE